MRSRTNPLILAVLLAAIAVLFMLRAERPEVTQQELVAVVILSGLALVAEFLAFLLPRGAVGSLSFIPVLAAVIIAPTWATLAGIAIVKVMVESARKLDFHVAVFNVSQYTLTSGLAALVFIEAGGVSFLELSTSTLRDSTAVNGVPAFAAFVTSFLANTLLVSAVIALNSRMPISSIWRTNHIATIGIDVLTAPIVFLFAWVYARFGPVAAATLWFPIVGIRQAHKTNLELERTNEELLELMVKSIEARDPYTSGHSRRVQEYSVQIARTLHLTEKEIELTSRAALLHDVGKIHEKYGPILSKADRLSPDEWRTMREHPDDGANLIATMSPLRELVELVRHHHENWDGTGYPHGLAGEIIPLPARIIRLADTIDAMTTERPYRPMRSEPEVRAEIVRCRGTQFDPSIVDRILSSPAWAHLFVPAEASTAPRYGVLGVVSNAKVAGQARRT
jgi:putative nucleotidyltransferase with HDIG domain